MMVAVPKGRESFPLAGLRQAGNFSACHADVPNRSGRAPVESISKAIGQTVPDLVSWQWTKADRKGLARLDYTQNAINKTLVAPFSTRPAPGAPVS